jgi:hypothetical protein
LQQIFRSEVDQQTGTRELTTDLRSEVNQQTGTRELTSDFRSYSYLWYKAIFSLFQAFAIFCGMGIDNTQMYEKVMRAVAKQQV